MQVCITVGWGPAPPAVLQTLRERVAANALELARQGTPRPPFYVTGQVAGQPFSVHAEGERVFLTRPGQPRQEVELVGPPAPTPETEEPADLLPAAVCPHAAPASSDPLIEVTDPGVSWYDTTSAPPSGAEGRDEEQGQIGGAP